MKTKLLEALALALPLLAGASHVRAGEENFDIDTRFRAKIAKEKVKQAALERENDKLGRAGDDSQCGSQNIGNIDTRGRPGTSPREVFIFAPNAIYLVGRGGCR
jgi:hypothetical protein